MKRINIMLSMLLISLGVTNISITSSNHNNNNNITYQNDSKVNSEYEYIKQDGYIDLGYSVEDNNSNFKNQEGFIHMTVEQAYDANEEYYYGRRWGNVSYKKDYWPINEPGVSTITSSIQAGVNLGYSFKNGFSLDNISVSEDRNIGANISFGYSKAITRSEPALSVQLNSSNTNKCEWYYTYKKDAAETNHLTTNYMFEISNSRNGMFVGDFRLKLDYKFIVDEGWFWAAETRTGSADLIIRAGEYKAIYDFCSGMV